MQFAKHKKNLIDLLKDGEFHSGSKLAESMGLSRTAVWNLIHELKDLNLTCNAVSGKGYRLSRPIELLDEALIRGYLNESASLLLSKLEIHDEIDSTNRHLFEQAKSNAPSGSLCLAEMQTAGKGRLGRHWVSPFANNISLSLLWHFEDHSTLGGLSLVVGVAVIRALRKLNIKDVGLKWPNDILWQNRKLGGILLEVSGEAHGLHAVVIGIGINFHIPSDASQAIDQAWVDLAEIAPLPSRNRLIALLLNELLPLLQNYHQAGLKAYIDEWRDYHCFKDKKVILHQGDHQTQGRLLDVSEAGLLIIEDEAGNVKQFASGDVRLRLDAN